MLTQLMVRDLAIVDNAELELGAGMTVLTGETGAGKSLIVDALELAVGGRASTDLVRADASSAEVVAVFEPNADIARWLREQALDDEDGLCVLRRVVGRDGRSRAFINARPVPVSQLRDLGERLVDVHGQHAHQALLNPATQRQLLDSFLDDAGALEEVARIHGALDELDRETADLDLGTEDPLARLDFLRFQIGELRAAPVAPDTLRAIGEEHRRLANGAEILDAVAQARVRLGAEDTGAYARVSAALRALEASTRLDPRLDNATTILHECATLLDEANAALRRYAEDLEADDGRLGELEQALATVHDLARKHRCPEQALHQRLTDLQSECAHIESATARLQQADAQRAELLARFRDCARGLYEARRRAADSLCAAVGDVLATLGMQGASIMFQIHHDADAAPARHGADQVALHASTNPGQAHMPLSRVASGGELSRIALAIHAVAMDERGATTVVFDEVDAGVGGAVAEIVGRRMRELGARRQVLTVTHLPQVAALAHGHVSVHKHQDGGGSHSRVDVLDDAAREQEVARMLGGVDVTRRTLAHAREMLAAAHPTAPRGTGGKKRRRPAA